MTLAKPTTRERVSYGWRVTGQASGVLLARLRRLPRSAKRADRAQPANVRLSWKPAYYYHEGPALSGAWPRQDVRRLFYESISARGCALVGGVQFAVSNIARLEQLYERAGNPVAAASVSLA